MSSRKRPRKKLSKKTTIKKRVNKKGYTNKYGTRVGPYNRKVSRFPNMYTTYRMVNGEQRLVKITRRNGKEYIQVLENRRRAKPITFAEAKKHFEELSERRQIADKRYKAKNIFGEDEITSSYITKTGTSRYDVDGLDTPPTKEEKPELAFGYGYDPNQLKNGIQKYKYSHTLEDGTKLYEFEPKLPYRLFKIFAEEMGYDSKGSVLIKGKTEIKNNYFVTDKDPETVIKELNKAIDNIYEKYEPMEKYDASITSKRELTEKEKELKYKAKGLPKLKSDEKYYIVSITPEGSVHYHGYSTDPEKAMRDYELEKKIFERHNIKGKIEIFPAKDLDEIRDRVHERKRAKFENYKVSGDTYPNRHTLRGYGLEWDAKEKAYRGKLSPEDIKDLEKISKLHISKDTEYTVQEKELSDKARKRKRNEKLKELEVKYGSWKDKYKPFTSEQTSHYNNYTHFPSDINKEYDERIRTKEASIKNIFDVSKIDDAPLPVKVALYRYKKELYDKYLEESRARATAPPVSVVGPSKYRGKPERADRIRKKASEQLHKSEKRLDVEITNEYNKQEKVQKPEIEFGPRGKNINSQMSELRKKHRIDITQSAKGSRNEKEWRSYAIRTKKDKIYMMEISETGSFSIHHYGPGGMILSKQIQSLNEMEFEINHFLEHQSK